MSSADGSSTDEHPVTDQPARAPHNPLVPPGTIDHHVRDMTVTLAADVTLANAQRKLAEASQWLPIDGNPDHPVGLLVERNSTGPLRLGYGAWRDLLLGCQFRNGPGDLVTAGGRTVKNVAGYDLTKFMVGQHGLFARIVTITTRTYRRPAAALLARFAPVPAIINHLMPTALRPQWSVLTPDSLWCGYLGDERTVQYYESALPLQPPAPLKELRRRKLDEDSAHRLSLWQPQGPGAIHFRASVPPSKILDFAKDAALQSWSADAAFGIVLAACPSVEHWDRARHGAEAIGGSAYAWTGETLLPIEPRENERKLLQRLKYAFDPDARLGLLPIEEP